MTFLDFGREATSNPAVSTKLEWLVTNGIGGYASGTVANLLTRSYHGLLVAALNPPLGRTLLLSKFDEMAMYDSQQYALSVDQWNSADAPLDPPSFQYLERFRLEGTTPVWTYAISDARLEKRVWMEQGANTTYVRYDLVQATRPLHLEIKALVNYRDFHGNTHAGDWHMQVELIEAGLKVSAFHGATPLYLLCDRAEAFFDHEWYRNYFHSEEAARGLDALEDNLYVGRFTKSLYAGDSVVLVASTESELSSDTAIAHLNRRTHEARLITESGHRDSPDRVKQLVLAADQFIVQRAVNGDPFGQSVIAGYHWFGDWGRDTMISLPGLTLATGRHEVAAKILRTFARYVDQGMLPNRFPDDGETPEYNTVDATLWYFNAVNAYFDVTHDDTLLQDLYPVLQEIIEWHRPRDTL